MFFSKMKDLLASSNRAKKIGLIMAGAIVMVTFAGLLIYQGTKKTITVTADGEKKEVQTHAETVSEVLGELEFEYKDLDELTPSKDR